MSRRSFVRSLFAKESTPRLTTESLFLIWGVAFCLIQSIIIASTTTLSDSFQLLAANIVVIIPIVHVAALAIDKFGPRGVIAFSVLIGCGAWLLGSTLVPNIKPMWHLPFGATVTVAILFLVYTPRRRWLSAALALAAVVANFLLPPPLKLLVVSPLLAAALVLLVDVRGFAVPTLLRVMTVLAFVSWFFHPVFHHSAWETQLTGTNVVSVAGRFGTAVADLDRDGVSDVFGQSDCRSFDGEVYPGALEVPGNDIDEDCTGVDLKMAFDITTERRPVTLVPPFEKPKVVLFITTDGLTDVDVSAATTPRLFDAGTTAKRYARAYAMGPATHITLPTWITAVQYPALELKPIPGQIFPAEIVEETFATAFKRQGYRTAAIFTGEFLAPEYWFGLLDDFDVVESFQKTKETDEATDRAIELISEQPTFLWIHYFDHHSPFPRIAGDLDASERDRFLHALAHTDNSWGRLLDAATERPDVFTMFTADHGEAFDGFHPHGRHNVSLKSSELHVPLFVWSPQMPRTDSHALISSIDMGATLAHVGGVCETQCNIHGRSLFEDVDRPYILAVHWERYLDRWRGISVRTNERYFIRDFDSGQAHVYDTASDPFEQHPLDEPETFEFLSFIAASWKTSFSAP